MRIDSKIFSYLLTVLLVIASFNLTITTLDILKSSKRLDHMKEDLSSLEQEKAALEDSIEYKKTEEYVEKVARNELNLVKENEIVYVLSDQKDARIYGQEDAGTDKQVLASHTKRAEEQGTLEERKENLEAWLRLMFLF